MSCALVGVGWRNGTAGSWRACPDIHGQRASVPACHQLIKVSLRRQQTLKTVPGPPARQLFRSGSNLFLTVAVRKAWRLVPLGWCGHEILEGGCEAGAAPPRVTRPGHMAEPQTFHSWQPQKRPTANILQKCRSLTAVIRFSENV